MKIILIIILLTNTISSFGQFDNDTAIYYKSGKLQMESKFDKTSNCEKVNEYFESGKIRSTKTFVHSNLNILVSPDTKVERMTVDNFQIDGADILYFENGTIQLYSYWKDGALSGRIYCNYSDGKLAYENYYLDKFKAGTWKFYNKDGGLREEQIFEGKTKTSWHSNDDYATDKFYFNNKLAYTVELVKGKKENLVVVDKENYDSLMESEPPAGQKLFMQNCSSCHSANVDLFGPMMKDVTDNRTNEWLIKMITNGDALLKSGDKDAVALYKKWNNTQHPNFGRLSSEEVDEIIDYIKEMK